MPFLRIPAGLDGFAGPLFDQGGAVYNVRSEGIEPDGSDVTSDAQDIGDAVRDAGGGVILWPKPSDPEAYYNLTDAIDVGDHVFHVCEGEVRNTRTSQVTYGDRLCFRLGWFHQADLPQFTWYDCADVAEGDYTLTLDTAADADDFPVGSILILRSVDAVRGGDNPLYLAFYRILASNSSTGVLTLDHPVPQAITTADHGGVQIASNDEEPTDGGGFGRTVRILDGGGVTGRVRSDDHFWMERTGMYRTRLQNIEVGRSRSLIIGNGFGRCIIENIHGTFTESLIELAFGSHDTHMRGIHGGYSFHDYSGITTPRKSIIVGGNARDVSLTDFSVNMGDAEPAATVRLQGTNLWVRRGTVYAPKVTENGVEFMSTVTEGGEPFADIGVEDVEFRLGSDLSRYARVRGQVGTLETTTVRRAHIRRCRFFGSPSSASSAVQVERAEDCRLEDNYLETGDIKFFANTSGNIARGNVLDDGEVTADTEAIRRANKVDTNTTPRSLGLGEVRHHSEGPNSVNSTTVGNEIVSRTLPAGSSVAGDVIEIVVGVSVSGTNGPKTIRVQDDTGTLATLSFASGDTGAGEIRMRAKVMDPARIWHVAHRVVAGVVQDVTNTSRTGLDLAANDRTYSVQAWVNNAADTIFVSDVDIRVVPIEGAVV